MLLKIKSLKKNVINFIFYVFIIRRNFLNYLKLNNYNIRFK